MAAITFKGEPVHTQGTLPEAGAPAPDFKLVTEALAEAAPADFNGRVLVLNIFPSVDTDVCAASVRRFNEAAASLEGAEVLCISMDLPFAQSRFCGAEGLENVTMLSAFRSPEFGQDYGVLMTDGPLAGLLSRAVVIIADGKTVYTEQVPEITQEPDYDAALKAAAQAV